MPISEKELQTSSKNKLLTRRELLFRLPEIISGFVVLDGLNWAVGEVAAGDPCLAQTLSESERKICRQVDNSGGITKGLETCLGVAGVVIFDSLAGRTGKKE